MVSGFLSGECCFGLKMTAECCLKDVHLKKYTIQNFYLPTFMNSDSPMFSGCGGPHGNIHLLESARKFRKME